MDPAHLELVCKEFDLGTPIFVEEDHDGVLNRNFDLTTDTGRYFIKSVRDRRKHSIPVIEAAESFMEEGGIPAVGMLKTRSGDLFVPAGEDVYTVYPYIAHVKPLALPFEALGEMLARIHMRGEESLPSLLQDAVMVERGMGRVKEKLAQYHERAEQDQSSYREAFLEYIELKRSLLESLPPSDWQRRVLAHGDYHDRNILFDADAQIIGICDWEKAELVPRAYELARSIQYICFRGRDASQSYDLETGLTLGTRMLDAYRSTFEIGTDELIAGFNLRLRKLVMSFWIEERFYDHQDERANQFIEDETQLIRDFSNPRIVERLIS